MLLSLAITVGFLTYKRKENGKNKKAATQQISTSLSSGANYDEVNYDYAEMVEKGKKPPMQPQPTKLREHTEVEESYVYYEDQGQKANNQVEHTSSKLAIHLPTAYPQGHEYFE